MDYEIFNFIGYVDSYGRELKMISRVHNSRSLWSRFCGFSGNPRDNEIDSTLYCDLRIYNTTKDFFCNNRYRKVFLRAESVGMSDIVRMIENKYVFLPASKKVSVADVKSWVKAGFIPVFMRAKDFAQWKKDFENWV